MGASGADTLSWSWKECTLLRMYEAFEFCLTLRAPRSEKSAERPSEGIEKVLAASVDLSLELKNRVCLEAFRRGLMMYPSFGLYYDVFSAKLKFNTLTVE